MAVKRSRDERPPRLADRAAAPTSAAGARVYSAATAPDRVVATSRRSPVEGAENAAVRPAASPPLVPPRDRGDGGAPTECEPRATRKSPGFWSGRRDSNPRRPPWQIARRVRRARRKLGPRRRARDRTGFRWSPPESPEGYTEGYTAEPDAECAEHTGALLALGREARSRRLQAQAACTLRTSRSDSGSPDRSARNRRLVAGPSRDGAIPRDGRLPCPERDARPSDEGHVARAPREAPMRRTVRRPRHRATPRLLHVERCAHSPRVAVAATNAPHLALYAHQPERAALPAERCAMT